VDNLAAAYYNRDKQYWGDRTTFYFRVINILIVIIQFAILLGYLCFMGFIYKNVGISAKPGSFRGAIIERVYYLSVASVAVLLFTVCLFIELLTISYDTGAFWTNNEYESNTAEAWFQWHEGFFSFFLDSFYCTCYFSGEGQEICE